MESTTPLQGRCPRLVAGGRPSSGVTARSYRHSPRIRIPVIGRAGRGRDHRALGSTVPSAARSRVLGGTGVGALWGPGVARCWRGQPPFCPKLSINAGYRDTPGSNPYSQRYHTKWIRNITTIPSSAVLRNISVPLGAVTAFSVAMFWAIGMWPASRLALCLWDTPHQLLSVALGLVLAFRTQTAYQRFWLAREAWQALVDHTRDFTRRAVTWCGGSDRGRAAAGTLASHVLGVVVATRAHLRASRDVDDLEGLLPSRSAEAIRSGGNMPLRASELLGQCVQAARNASHLTELQALELDGEVRAILQAVGKCEVIARTPLPREVSRHSSRFLTLWCWTLPFVLVKNMGVMSIPATFLISYALMAIEHIASLIESPFEVYLPLDDMVATLEADLFEMVTRNGEDGVDGATGTREYLARLVQGAGGWGRSAEGGEGEGSGAQGASCSLSWAVGPLEEDR